MLPTRLIAEWLLSIFDFSLSTVQIAPVIHDWSYGGLCFDLLPIDGNKYEYQVRVEGSAHLLPPIIQSLNLFN